MEIEERIAAIEKELRETPHHKGTDHHIGRLRAKLAQLKDQFLEQAQRQKSGGSGGYAVRKSGDATVVLVGPPSVGKSSLLNAITDAHSAVADYDFTTLTVIPGMMAYNGAKIQIFDIPGIIKGAAAGKGRGKEVLSVARTANLVVLMVDVRTTALVPEIKEELTQFGFRLNQQKPKITVNKKLSGGLKVSSTTPLTHLTQATVKEIAQQFRIVNAEIIIRENLTVDRLIDGLMPNRVFVPYLVAVNKADLGEIPEGLENEAPLVISVHDRKNIETLKEVIWEKLGLIRIFLKKEIAGEPDFAEPLIIPAGTTVIRALEKISGEMAEEVEVAQIWGPSAKYPGQKVSLKHLLQDKDVLFFHK